MTVEEYKKLYREISDRAYKEKGDAARQCAIDNNTYKIGDLVTDHAYTIRIEKMEPYMAANNTPMMRYFGVWLKKDGTPNKKGEKWWSHQENIISK
jgi:hypothetical protein